LQELTSKDQKVLFVATKKQAQEVVREVATSLGMPFCVNRWLGECLANFETVKRDSNKYRRFLAMEADGCLATMLKKESSVIRRQMIRMHRGFEEMLEVNDLPDALFIVDVNYENTAVMEANHLHMPIVAIIDTNSDPTHIAHVIPANDDSVKSMKIILETVSEAIQTGRVACNIKQSDSKRRQTIISNEEMTRANAITMDAAFENEAEKITDKNEEAAIASREKPVVTRRKHSTKKVEEKIEEKSPEKTE
jgi:small subunit ribosomal protein S2